jgi:hypothetical protein
MIRSTQRDRREAILDGHDAWLQIPMSMPVVPPPQSRPARTLVLIFMVSSFGLDGMVRSTQRDRREANLGGRGAWLQIKISPPPQSRPARTLVLIFMVSSLVLGGWEKSRSVTGARRASAVADTSLRSWARRCRSHGQREPWS